MDCKMVIIKNKGCRISFNKVYQHYLPILHTGCKTVIIKNKGCRVCLIKFLDNYSYLKELNLQYLSTLHAVC